MTELLTKDYRTVSYVSGPLIFVEGVQGIKYGELVDIRAPGGEMKRGQVLEMDGERAVIQVFEETRGLDVHHTSVRFTGELVTLGLSREMVGRVLNGLGEPRDGLKPYIAEQRQPIIGSPINPASREKPSEFIQTGISAIDGMNTLVRGQKLPIFSGSGLPANEIAAQICQQATVRGSGEEFVVVFGAMGITQRESSYFMRTFSETGALSKGVFFLNHADDPIVERLMTPKAALTAAEYLAFDLGMHVLVILSDMTNYCEALRELSNAREEVPGRRGYPGYMYTDLSQIYERAGRIKGKEGSVTQLIILTMPDDDITHPIADLTGYITEGQIVLSRELFRRGLNPPIDVLPSLSRLMNLGVGPGKTRDDHRELSNQMYALYAQGRDLRKLVAIVGEEAIDDRDRRALDFADEFEEKMISQGWTDRSIDDTLDLAWKLLERFPRLELKRIKAERLDEHGFKDEAVRPAKTTEGEAAKESAATEEAEAAEDALAGGVEADNLSESVVSGAVKES